MESLRPAALGGPPSLVREVVALDHDPIWAPPGRLRAAPLHRGSRARLEALSTRLDTAQGPSTVRRAEARARSLQSLGDAPRVESLAEAALGGALRGPEHMFA